MTTERQRVLQMLKEGIIDTEEAERLLDSLGSSQTSKSERMSETSSPNPQWTEIQKQLGEQFSGLKQFVENTIDNISNKFKAEFKEGKYAERLSKQAEKSKQEIKLDRKDNWTYGDLKFESSAGAMNITNSSYSSDFLYIDFESQVTKVPALIMQEVDFIKHTLEEVAPDKAQVKVSCSAGNGKVYLGPAVIWKLNLIATASALSLDLSKIKWQEAAITLYTAQSTIKIGDIFATTSLNLNFNASRCKIKLVEDTPLRIKLNSVISPHNIESLKLNKEGEYLVSNNFNPGQPYLDLNIDLNVSNLTIEKYSNS